MTAEINAIIDQIEKAAEGATPGPWKVRTMATMTLHVMGPSEIVHPDDGVCMPDRMNDRSFAEDGANMRFIAACNPQNVTALIKAYREMEARLVTAYEVKYEQNQEANFQRKRANDLEAALMDGNRPIPYERDTLGRFVREAWVRWAETQPSPKPSWLVPYDELSEPDKEADRQIGETIARWTLIGDAAALATKEPTND